LDVVQNKLKLFQSVYGRSAGLDEAVVFFRIAQVLVEDGPTDTLLLAASLGVDWHSLEQAIDEMGPKPDRWWRPKDEGLLVIEESGDDTELVVNFTAKGARLAEQMLEGFKDDS